ncbi:rhomboid family intramembrane serine protease [Zavarzinia sp. CC-PAN008]|uniref:rhomboid family intramembrane serine protease n=1 Tax=Zavarzinia sp. CC-PAN008 TaxID=3243332 RepID=UPI003F7450E2
MALPLHDDQPTRFSPHVTWALIAINVLIYLLQQQWPQGDDGAAMAAGLIPAALTGLDLTPADLTWLEANRPLPEWSTLFSYQFVHGSTAHLLGNMLFLWIFGNNVEDTIGRLRFVVFYLTCGVLAAVAEMVAEPASPVPLVGASGAISGVLGAYFLLHPRARIWMLLAFIPLRVPAWAMIGLWFVMQLWDGLTGAAEAERVAWLAHVGGFVAGLALIKPFMPRRRGPWG